MSPQLRLAQRLLPIAAIALSLIFALTRGALLPDDIVALIVTVALQFYLPGYLLARALGKHQSPNPVVRFAWVLVAAFALTIVLGAAARLLQVPVSAYVILLHVLMLALALLRPPQPASTESGASWRLTLTNAPLYLLVLLCCGIVLYVGLERNQFRFNGYEDQTVFVSLADWLAHDPPDPGLRSRRIGVDVGDTRWDTDGWTYTHAVWVWSSGRPAADLIWSDLTPLFIWTIPLAVFGMTYELTRRESAAAWSTAALTFAGLLTLDSLVYVPTSLAFGQYALFQVNTLRTISTALVTPLAVMAVFAYLHRPSWRLLLLIWLIALATATLHPRQIVILLVSGAATAGLWWLADRSWRRFAQAVALTVALASIMTLPLIQRSARPFIDVTANQVEQQLESPSPTQAPPTATVRPAVYRPPHQTVAEPEASVHPNILVLNEVPLLGTTFVMRPSRVFYHPLVIAATVLGLLFIVGWRRGLAAQSISGTTLALLILLFTPGLTPIIARLATLSLTPSLIFGLPIAVIFGVTLDVLLTRLRLTTRGSRWLTVGAAGLLLMLLFEPFAWLDIPASARDQIRASNVMQSTRDMHPADQALIGSLRVHLPADDISVLITPNRVANYVIESVPRTLITGGRGSGNEASGGTRRFLTDSSVKAPWLDTSDFEFIAEWGVTHIVLEAEDSRLPQLLLQRDRFELLDRPAGYAVFRVLPDIETTRDDNTFRRMNRRYGDVQPGRWRLDSLGFDLTQPVNADDWEHIATRWDDAARTRDADQAALGAAFTHLFRDDFALARAEFDQLHQRYPDIFLFNQALAEIDLYLGDEDRARDRLLAALASDNAQTRLLAARLWLTETFFYLLDDDMLDRVLAVTERDPLLWEHVSLLNDAGYQRERVVLLMSRGRWDKALEWQLQIKDPVTDPRDLVTRGALHIALDQVTTARSVLESAGDSDYYAANRFLHPDRWEGNIAARMNVLWFGDSMAAQPFTTDPYVVRASAYHADDDQTLTIHGLFGNPHINPFPVRDWYFAVVDTAGTVFFFEETIPAQFSFDTFTNEVMHLNFELPPDIDALTPALFIVEPRYSNRVTFGQTIVPLTLNRPPPAELPAAAEPVGARFGGLVTLEAYTSEISDESLTLTLYWQTDSIPPDDYQIFVHVVAADGTIVAQRDSAPVDGRYPTRQWRSDTLIEDRHMIALATPLPRGSYDMRIGMYTLPDAVRLPVAGDGVQALDDALVLQRFNLQTGTE